ncbi:MAG: hypothetical protein ABI036_18865, partial [Fibrobacteria bacterium]
MNRFWGVVFGVGFFVAGMPTFAEGTLDIDNQNISDLPDESCESGWPSKYFITPPNMLDWTPTQADIFPVLEHPPTPAMSDMYNTATDRIGSPGSTIGSNEGRLTTVLRAVAQRRDPALALCDAAKAFADIATPGIGVGMITIPRPTGTAWGNAFADLAVTGRNAFERFLARPPTLNNMRKKCPGVGDSALNRALNRSYLVANTIRVRDTLEQPTDIRRELGWIAVSGEDDKPYRPINVPTASYPQFNASVEVSGIAGQVQKINIRYMIAHAVPPVFGQSTTIASGGGRQVIGDLKPTIAPNAEVLIFVPGMDSRLEEAGNLTGRIHELARKSGGKNWTVISLDLPTQGYSDDLDPMVFGPAGGIGCHSTAMLDFLENFIVRFIDTVDKQTGGQLKPRIRAVVGGSLGGSMALRLGRRGFLPGATSVPWIRNVVSWSPASIWPPITNRSGILAGCDHGWDAKHDVAVGWPR